MSVKTIFRLLTLCVLLASVGCKTSQPAAITDPDLQLLATWISGDFNNHAQHLRDSTFEDQVLHIRRIRERDKHYVWLYSELALAGLPNKPFEQRIYQVDRQDAKILRLKMFTLADPATYTGAYQHPEVLKKLRSADMLPQEGCTLTLDKRKDGSYGGGVQGKGCAEARQGAAYATTQLVVKTKLLRYWERGFDGEGQQIWGPVTGGVDFVKE